MQLKGSHPLPNGYISHSIGSMSDAYLHWQHSWKPGAWQTCKSVHCTPKSAEHRTLRLLSSYTALWHVFTDGIVCGGRWLEAIGSDVEPHATLPGCCDHMGQHMELFPLLSPGLFRHVSWALIMHFSAWGENWSIWAELASVPCGQLSTNPVNQ